MRTSLRTRRPPASGPVLARRRADGGTSRASGLSAETPTVAAAAEAAGLGAREAQKLVDALVRRGRLVKVGEDLYYPPDRLEALMGRLAAAMEAAGQLTLAEARDLLGTSRRYAQALLEHMDSEGHDLAGRRRAAPAAPPALEAASSPVSGPTPSSAMSRPAGRSC